MSDTEPTEVYVPEEITGLGVDHIYGGNVLPRGADRVEDRLLARYMAPGATHLKHGLVPIAELRLPSGGLMPDGEDAGMEEVETLPFRFPSFAHNMYAIRYGGNLYAIVRNVLPLQVSIGMLACVQLNDARNWDYFFGHVRGIDMARVTIEMPDGNVKQFSIGELQFLGRVTQWWMDGIPGELWIERDESGKARALLGIDEDGRLVSDAVARKAAYRLN